MRWQKGDRATCRHCHMRIEHDGDRVDAHAWLGNKKTQYWCAMNPADEKWHAPMAKKLTQADKRALLKLERMLR